MMTPPLGGLCTEAQCRATNGCGSGELPSELTRLVGLIQLRPCLTHRSPDKAFIWLCGIGFFFFKPKISKGNKELILHPLEEHHGRI